MRKWLGLALLCASQAQAATWDFTIDGLDTQPNPCCDFNQFGGSFTAEDRNLDGTLSLDEVTAFSVAGYQVLPVITWRSKFTDFASSLNAFSYAGGALSFVALSGEPDAFMGFATGAGLSWITPSFVVQALWTPNTVITVSPVSQVPEPATALLFLMPLAALVRRSKRQSLS
jgi:hypothetical protein